MGVVRANIQTVEDIYQLIWTAIASKRPIEAVYKGRPAAVLSPSARSESIRRTTSAVLSIWWRKRERTASTGITSQLALHRAGEVQPSPPTRGRVAHDTQPFAP